MLDKEEAQITIKVAQTPADFTAAKNLCTEYASWLGIDLCFQGFEEEMNNFPGPYKPVLLAYADAQLAGTVCLKAHSETVCEMKRLYVKPEFHGLGIGRLLCLELIAEAQRQHFETMLLDTLRRLEPAIGLYKKLGFTECAPYNANPEVDVTYMQKTLSL